MHYFRQTRLAKGRRKEVDFFYFYRFSSRYRNFLVGSGAQSSDNEANDISSCFTHGRVLTIMVATWNTGEAPKLYEQNYTPNPRQPAKAKEEMLKDMSDILLPTSIDFVSDLIIVCTQEMSIAKNRYGLHAII